MKISAQSFAFAAGLLVASMTFAQAPVTTTPAKPYAAPASTPAATTTTSKKAATPVPATTAAGGGADKVWVNPKSKTYHCYGTKYYGKTTAGEYMTEADAKAKGNHADHGKACKA